MKFKSLVYSKKSGLDLVESEKEDRHNFEVHYSSVNYKDALGVTGKGAIFKVDPIVPGIDLAGKDENGQLKIANGCGFGENFDGGYTEFASLNKDLLIDLPEALSIKEAMALGTAGFTAGLAVHRMLQNGQEPSKGPILISGATGGVGSFAIQIFNKLGYEVHALTHRPENEELLKSFGAHQVLSYERFQSAKVRPLEKALYGGVVDNLGGDFLTQALPRVSLWGNVASIGLALSPSLESSVMPFILRGVSLLGVSSANCRLDLRKEVWAKLSKEWKPKKILELINSTLSLSEVLDYSHKLIDHKVKGRALVQLRA